MEESLLLDFPNGECAPLPDSTIFSSEAEAFGWAQRQASTGGYAFSNLYKNKSKVTGDIILSCYNCDKGPKTYQNKPTTTSKSKQRDGTGSKKCGCQYKITIKPSESKKWVIIPKNSHNHGRNSSSIAHPAHRIAALQNTLRAEILNAANSGSSISQIMSAFREREGFNLIGKDISNIIQKERQKQLGGMTPLQWLLKELQDNGYNPRFETKDGNILSKLMYLYPQAIQLWKDHPDVLLMDCTYKTNRFNMPILNICGVTGGNKVIQLGLVFLSSEKENDYSWSLQQLKQIMTLEAIRAPLSIVTDRELALMKSLEAHFSDTPHLLCRWHVNMNVLAKSKKYFPKPTKKGNSYVRSPIFVEFLKQWNAVLAATSEETYKQEVAKLEAMAPKDAYIYVERTWLIWKEKIVRFWVDKQLHFGYTVTSTVEGCHSSLKGYLRRSTYDLKGVYDKLLFFWAAQQSSIADTEAQDQQKPRHNTSHPTLSKLIGHIHNYALQKLVLEIRKMPLITEQVPPCSCVMRVAYGLPCFHEIFKCLQEKRQLNKTDLHPHWWFKRDVAQNINMGIDILDPEIISTRGRPRGALGGVSREAESSTRRYPSEFEHILQEERSESFRGSRRGQGPQRRDNSTTNTPLSPIVVSTSLSTTPIRAQKRKREIEDEMYHVTSRAPLHKRVSRSTTALGIARLEASGDTYEPGTTSERSSAMALSMIWRDGHIDEPEAITATLCAMGADDDEEQD